MKIFDLVSLVSGKFLEYATPVLTSITDKLHSLLYFKIFGLLPFVAAWILVGFFFFTVRLRGLPFRLISHTVDVIKGKYDSDDSVGLFTHKEAICTAALGTVGLGSVAGVAMTLVIGGPGAIFWMVIVGLLGISVKFAEVTLAHKYRVVEQKSVHGGPFEYIKMAFKGRYSVVGTIMSMVYALAMVGISITSVNMFQSNQTTMALGDSFEIISQYKQYFALILVLVVGSAVLGGVKIIARIGSFLVPLMSGMYILLAVVIIGCSAGKILDVFALILREAFNMHSLQWGMIGAMVQGAARSIYTTESGVGTSGMAHAPSKTNEPVREGLTVIIEAFFPILVSVATGLVIVITGVYQSHAGLDGVLLTKAAFVTVAPWFGNVLSIGISFIAMTTAITWGYYGRLAWNNVFKKCSFVYYIIFFCATYYGCISSEQGLILKLADTLFVLSTIPNMIALYLLQKEIYSDTQAYYLKYHQ